jgi:probable F420-dependent oxidoreductase
VKFAFTHPMISHPYDPELASGAGITAIAVAAEAAGFHGFGFTDHPAPPQRWLEAGGHDALDPFVAMAFAAASTTTLRLVPNIVVLPYRNPFIVAKAGATLDLLSAGRFTLAVGTGYLKREFAALGVSYDARNEIFDEALEILHAVWTSDEVTFEGRHFNARGITAHPRPTSLPRPPIWIGGNTRVARRRVAKHGDGWCPFPAPAGLAQAVGTTAMDTPETLAAGISDLRACLEAQGRDAEAIDIVFTNTEGGSPARNDFNAEAHLESLEELAALGVTWVQVSMPGDSLGHVLETIGRYGETVITRR